MNEQMTFEQAVQYLAGVSAEHPATIAKQDAAFQAIEAAMDDHGCDSLYQDGLNTISWLESRYLSDTGFDGTETVEQLCEEWHDELVNIGYLNE